MNSKKWFVICSMALICYTGIRVCYAETSFDVLVEKYAVSDDFEHSEHGPYDDQEDLMVYTERPKTVMRYVNTMETVFAAQQNSRMHGTQIIDKLQFATKRERRKRI